MTHPDFITTSEIATYLRVSKQQVYRLVRERGLPGRRVKGRWVFRQSLVEQWVYKHLRPESSELVRPSEARKTLQSLSYRGG